MPEFAADQKRRPAEGAQAHGRLLKNLQLVFTASGQMACVRPSMGQKTTGLLLGQPSKASHGGGLVALRGPVHVFTVD